MLNLLPPEIKEQRRVKSLLYSLTLGYIAVAVVIGLGLAGFATWGFVQQGEIGNRESTIQQLAGQRKSKEQIIAKASFVEDRLTASSTLVEKRKWEEILNLIATATPSDTTLGGIRVANTPTGQTVDLSVSGKTSDRRSIVLFRDKLEAEDTVTKTTILSLSEEEANGQKLFSFALSAVYTEPKEPATE
jgi:hypothetical protein